MQARTALALLDPEIVAGAFLGFELGVPVEGQQLVQRRRLEAFAHAGAQPPVAAEAVADIAAEADMRAELLVVVHPCPGMRGQPPHHPAKLRIGAADFGVGRSIEAGFERGPFVVAAKGQRQSAQQAVFAAQRNAFGAAVAGEGFGACAIAIGAFGVRTAVGGAQREVVAVIGQPDIAPVAGGLLRIPGIRKHESGCGEAVDIDLALGEIAMREQLEAWCQIDEGGRAQRELLRTVGLGARGGCRKPVGFVPRTGQAEENAIIARACRRAGKQRIARAVFDAATEPAIGPRGNVNDAADRFGTPDRAVRTAQHIDLARSAEQQIAEVEPARGAGLVGHAHAVDQDQHLVRTGPAQIDAGHPADPAAARQRQARDTVQCPRRVGPLQLLDLVAFDDGDRLAGVAQIGAEPVGGNRDHPRIARRRCRSIDCGRRGPVRILPIDDLSERLFARALRQCSSGHGRSRQEKQVFVHVTSYHRRNAVHDGREQYCSFHVCLRYTPPAAERQSWAGLLAPGSTLSRRLPGPGPSGMWRDRSPVTVAGAAEGLHLLPSSGLREQANP